MTTLTNIKINGHDGTWNSLESKRYLINGKRETIHLFKNVQNDNVNCIFANTEGKIFLENVINGWNDWKEFVIDPNGNNDNLIFKAAI